MHQNHYPKPPENPINEALFENLTWMTSKEAAYYRRVSVPQLRNMVWRGQLKSYHLGTKLRFLKSDLDLLLVPQQRRLYGYQAV